MVETVIQHPVPFAPSYWWEPKFGPRELPPPTDEEIRRFVDGVMAKIQKSKESTMHYRNGREAKNGDKIVQLDSEGKITAFGVLHSAAPGNDYCNGQIASIQQQNAGACMCDCLHLDDVAALLKDKGLDVRPKGM